jgi:hypothetical protein
MPPVAWAGDIDQLVFRGSHLLKEVFFLHKKSRTLILDDIIQNHPLLKGNLFHNALARFGGVKPPGGVALDIRLTFTNRKLARQSLERLLSWDFDKLIIAHGPCIDKDAKPFVERAFQWLKCLLTVRCRVGSLPDRRLWRLPKPPIEHIRIENQPDDYSQKQAEKNVDSYLWYE